LLYRFAGAVGCGVAEDGGDDQGHSAEEHERVAFGGEEIAAYCADD
jgi:hypothetical protein